MLAIERRQRIKDIVSERKSASVAELAKEFSVTAETIRRDLRTLEQEGALLRSHGGAFIQTGVENLVDATIRTTAYVESKRQIARRCRPLISNGDAIFLDNSTTSYYLAEAIASMRLTVVTNNLPVINLFNDSDNVHLIGIGGMFSKKEQGFYGSAAVTMISEYFFDKAFLSCRSLSLEHGVTESTEEWALVRQAVIRHSNERYLVADQSKVGHTSFMRICGFEQLTGVITDAPLDKSWHDSLGACGCHIYDRIAES